MGQRLQPWRSEHGERLWLSMLVDTMEKLSREKLSRPDLYRRSCHPSVRVALEAQLGRPAFSGAHGASRFSLRN